MRQLQAYTFLITSILWNLLMGLSSNAQIAPNEQDCLGAIVICQELYNQPNSFSGEGNHPNEIPNTTCLGSGEENNVWYTFTAQSSGLLCFTISPYNISDDYDWAVFSLENYSCEDLWDHADEMIVGCNFNATPGGTGPNGNTGPQNEPCIPINVGVTYVVNVSNFSATQFGYVLDFSASSAQLFDNTPPRIGFITNTPLKCGNDTINFLTSELVKCKTVEKEDFTIIGGGGPYTVTQLLKPNCDFLEDKDNRFGIVISPPLQANGAYMFILNGNAGYIEDQCGNLAKEDTLIFNLAPLELSLNSKKPSCADSKDGYAIVNVESNPNGAFNFVWKDNTNTIIESHLNKGSPDTLFGLGQGLHTVEVGLCGTGTLFISAPSEIDDNPIIQNDNCSDSIGFIDPKPFGGTPPYSFVWSNGTTNQRNTGLPKGDYTVIITDNTGCTFEETYTIHNLFQPEAEAGPNDVVCGFRYQLNAVPSQGLGTWTDNSNGKITYLGSVNNPKSIVEIDSEDAVTFYWTEVDNGCEDKDSVRIIFNAQPESNAGEDFVSCQLQYRMDANPTVGSGLWSTPNVGVTFSNNTNPNTLITVATPGNYTFVWRELNKGCVDRDTVVGAFYDYPVPFAGNDDKVIGNTYSLLGSINPMANSVEWSSDCTVLFDPNKTTEQPNIQSEYGCCNFYYAYHFDECSNFDTVQICFVEQPITNAGVDDSICGFEFTLDPTVSVGQTKWITSSTNVTFFPNDEASHPLVTVDSPGAYTFIFTETNDIAFDSDTVTIWFFDKPDAIAGRDSAICDSTIILYANTPSDSGWWQGPSHISFIPDKYQADAKAISSTYGNDTLIWNLGENGCFDADSVIITFIEQPKANAGLNDSVCGDTILLNASPSVGVGFWGNQNGLSFLDSSLSNTTASLNNNPYGTYVAVWTEANSICLDTDFVNIEFVEQPMPITSPDTNVCGFFSDISVNNTIGSGIWTVTNPTISIFDSSLTSTIVDVSNVGYGTYIFYWTETNDHCIGKDSITITFFEIPNPFGGENDTICGDNYQLQARGSTSTGAWYSGTGTFSNSSDPNSTFTPNAYGNHMLVWQEINGPCIENDTVELVFFEPITINAGSDSNLCGLIGNLNGTLSSGTGSWRALNNSIVLSDSTDPNTEFEASSLPYGTYQFEWTETNGNCIDKDTIEYTLIEIPTPYAGADDSVCGDTYQLNARPSIGHGKWTSEFQLSTYSPSDTHAITSATVQNYGLENFIWTEVNQSCSSSDSVAIHFFATPISNAGADQSICGLSIQLSANPSIGVGVWQTNDSTNFTDTNNANSMVSTDSFGESIFVWKESNGLCIDRDSVTIHFYESPIADFTVSDSIITTLDLTISTTNLSQLGTSYLWDFGDHTIYNNFEPSHTYNALGDFTITLITSDNYGCIDSNSLVVTVTEDGRVFMPNTFSPNGDGLNETIKPSILGVRTTNYQFTIFDRWGKKVYQDSNPNNSWDGSLPDASGKANQGVYPYIIEYKSFGGQTHVLKGRIHLIK